MNLNLFPQISYDEYHSGITLTNNQQTHLVDQVITQLDKFYSGVDNRKMV